MSRTRSKRGPAARRELGRDEVLATLGGERSPALLHALGLTNASGGATADAHRKLKQVAHFLRLIEPAVTDVLERHSEPIFVDAAAGKSYLGLALYETRLRAAGRGRVICVESRPDLVARVRGVACQLGMERVEVVGSSLLEAELPQRVHFVLALHACDTATDEALVRGVRASADHVALVPCCQAEVARLLRERGRTGGDELEPLWREPIHRREFGAHVTNVLRTLALRAQGHAVTVTELTGWEHSLKNELILGRRVSSHHAGAAAELEALQRRIGVRPWLARALDAGIAAGAQAREVEKQGG